MNILKSLTLSVLLVAGFASLGATALADSKKEMRPLFQNGSFITIGAEGKTLVRGAEVTAVSDTAITAETTHGDTTLIWTVNTDADTEYVGTKEDSNTRATIETGDTISFSGVLTSSLTVAGDVVREWMHALGQIGLGGKIQSVSDSSFVLSHDQSGKRDVTVEVTSDTTITQNGDTIAFADLETGMRVKAVGTYSADGKTLTASSVMVGEMRTDKEDKEDKDHKPWKPLFDFFAKFKGNS